MPKPLPQNCLNVEGVADFLGVAPLTVRRLIQRRELKVLRIGRRIAITPAGLDKFVAENEE
ncbi:helix-turn-helix domain-containing protein [Bradyrhizobium betae]|uniref:Helix-turn-helix domain-containing protein n=1 Tax=Bradyrhizobium betae TaxID=244734 RepID=A0A5P6P4E2_9BRAD|nr:helix-turn-helix domain-containing protein [Bradyrhizobium betae]MCS3731222.1 excisionase family DNA binding protein [Bradyrhizobium betae]QFI73180.1 helix-turn-helix domain-containing protein [Bradyrhizobium betae]